MVTITQIPISGKMREQFEVFLKGTQITDWSFSECVHFKVAQASPSFYPDAQPICDVCGHPIRRICLFDKKGESYRKSLGICCATNLLAMIEYKGDTDKLNYDRTVELQKKTMMKRFIEADKARKAIELETKYHTEFKYCTDVVEAVTKKYPKMFEHWTDDSKLSKPVRQFSEFLVWLKQGTVNEYHLGKLREAMSGKEPKDWVLEVDNYAIVAKKQNKARQCIAKLLDVEKGGNFIVNMSHWGGDYTPKQIEVIERIARDHNIEVTE
ncbi:hypothetical protein ACFL96_19060 [Thermoproteota archaeon]